MRLASWSWGGRQQVGTVSPNGREVTPLALPDAARGALPLIQAMAQGAGLPPADASTETGPAPEQPESPPPPLT